MKYFITLLLGFVFLLASCGGSKEETFDHVKYGYGPIKKVDLGAIDQQLADKGQKIFESKCVACHKIDQKLIGPKLGGITKSRTPEFIMNMILNPDEMIQKNPEVKKLHDESNNVSMTFQNVTQEDARAILEYFRTCENK
jgi:cytochrome c